MKLKHFIYGLIGFLLIGEVILRIDQQVAPFAQDDHIFLPVKLAETPELAMVKNNSVPLDDSTYRVVVLGDSYINGWNTDANKKFSNVLRANLSQSLKGKYKKALVLDISRPGNNTIDNYKLYNDYYNRFKPQAVILTYNVNDIEDSPFATDSTNNKAKAGAATPTKLSATKIIYSIIYDIHIVQFVLHNFHSYLKSLGVVIPNSELDNQLKSYTQNRADWVKSKITLDRMMQEITARNEKMVVVLMPEFNLINNLKAFSPAYNIIGQYFTGHPNTTFINPVKYFKNYPVKDLRVSKYDGHPSVLAHKILADSIGRYLTITVK